MLQILLESYATYTCEEIYKSLVKSQEQCFEVLLPRIPYEEGINNYLMICDYYAALYCGELLFKLSTEFSYRVPLENSRLPFYFRFKTSNVEQLAETIFHLASAADWLVDCDRWWYYETEKNNFCFSCLDGDEYAASEGLVPVIYDLLIKTEHE